MTMLDRSTVRLRRRGAAVKNLAHSASLHSNVKNAPSNPGIKHLGRQFDSQIQYIAPGSPWENGYCENFNRKLKDERLRYEIFYSLKEGQTKIGL